MSTSAKTALRKEINNLEKAFQNVVKTSATLQDCVSKNCKDANMSLLKGIQTISDPKNVTEDTLDDMLKSMQKLTFEDETNMSECAARECLLKSEEYFNSHLAFSIASLKFTEAASHHMTEIAMKSSKPKTENKRSRSKKPSLKTLSASSK